MTLPDAALPRRFHRVLVEEIRSRRPDYLREPFTVAEIYQDLIPYGTHRDRLGVEMNADYEDTILRLLAGEGELLVLESEAARRDLASEIRSPQPDTGLFRNYAAATVRLAGDPPDRDAATVPGSDDGAASAGELEGASASGAAPDGARASGAAPDGADASDGAPGGADAPGAAPSGAFEGATPAEDPPAMGGAPSPGDAPSGAGDAPSEEGEGAPACPWCREHLPERESLRFCPFCGTSLEVVPCPDCGEELERHWRFCVRCGSETGA